MPGSEMKNVITSAEDNSSPPGLRAGQIYTTYHFLYFLLSLRTSPLRPCTPGILIPTS